jgi:hypothetical protein
MKFINIFSITVKSVLMLSPAISFASFPVSSDTTKIQKETLENSNSF